MTAKDAQDIQKAIESNSVVFTIAYIRCTTGPFMFAKTVKDSGILGDITMVRVRNGHNQGLNGVLPDYWFDPAQTGGGAMTDLGCHQMYLLDWMFGTPSTVNAMYSYYTSHVVEDSGVATALYNDGKTLAIMDSSFTTYYSRIRLNCMVHKVRFWCAWIRMGWKYIFPKMRSRGLLRNMKGMSTKRYLGIARAILWLAKPCRMRRLRCVPG